MHGIDVCRYVLRVQQIIWLDPDTPKSADFRPQIDPLQDSTSDPPHSASHSALYTPYTMHTCAHADSITVAGICGMMDMADPGVRLGPIWGPFRGILTCLRNPYTRARVQ